MRLYTGVYGNCKRVYTENWFCEKNPLPHRGIEPASAACRSDALPTELHPHPLNDRANGKKIDITYPCLSCRSWPRPCEWRPQRARQWGPVWPPCPCFGSKALQGPVLNNHSTHSITVQLWPHTTNTTSPQSVFWPHTIHIESPSLFLKWGSAGSSPDQPQVQCPALSTRNTHSISDL